MLDNIQILSSTNITVEQAKQWAINKGATQTFVDNAELYWKISKERSNVNPAVAYVQYGLETRYGKFGNGLDESYNNPCGLKSSIRGNEEGVGTYKIFESWEHGISAHIDHLAIYAGDINYPKFSEEVNYFHNGNQYKINGTTEDPRHFPYLLSACTSVIELGNKWSPSPYYSSDLMRTYNELSVTEIETKDTKSLLSEYSNKDNSVDNSTLERFISNLENEIRELRESNRNLQSELKFNRAELEKFNNVLQGIKDAFMVL